MILKKTELFDLNVTLCVLTTWPFNCSGYFSSFYRRYSALVSIIIQSRSMPVSTSSKDLGVDVGIWRML